MDEQISNLSLSKVSEDEVEGGGSTGLVILSSTQRYSVVAGCNVKRNIVLNRQCWR